MKTSIIDQYDYEQKLLSEFYQEYGKTLNNGENLDQFEQFVQHYENSLN